MKAIVIKIKDETGSRKIFNEVDVSFNQETVKVKDIITARVMEEVRLYNEKLPDYFMGLVQPSNAEKVLNGYKMRERKKIDAEKQVYVALDAFQKNGYFILIDDKQADDLEQEVMLSSSTQVSFVKLTPLVGG